MRVGKWNSDIATRDGSICARACWNTTLLTSIRVQPWAGTQEEKPLLPVHNLFGTVVDIEPEVSNTKIRFIAMGRQAPSVQNVPGKQVVRTHPSPTGAQVSSSTPAQRLAPGVHGPSSAGRFGALASNAAASATSEKPGSSASSTEVVTASSSTCGGPGRHAHRPSNVKASASCGRR